MLKTFEFAAVLAALVFAVALVGLMVLYSSQPSYAPEQQQSSENYDPSQEKREQSKSFWERTTQDPVAFFTLWLAIFTMVLSAVAVIQIKFLIRAEGITTKTAQAAKDSAEAAKEAVTLSDKTAGRQLRAYVSADKGVITIEGTKIECFFSLKNSGQTPAYKLSTKPKIVINRTPDNPVFATINREINMGAIIGPGGEFEINGKFDLAINAPDAELVKILLGSIDDGSTILYIYGRVDYEDVFDKFRTLYYRFKAVKHISGQWALQPEAEGNYETK